MYREPVCVYHSPVFPYIVRVVGKTKYKNGRCRKVRVVSLHVVSTRVYPLAPTFPSCGYTIIRPSNGWAKCTRDIVDSVRAVSACKPMENHGQSCGVFYVPIWLEILLFFISYDVERCSDIIIYNKLTPESAKYYGRTVVLMGPENPNSPTHYFGLLQSVCIIFTYSSEFRDIFTR